MLSTLVVLGLVLLWGHGRLPPREGPAGSTPPAVESQPETTGLSHALQQVLPAHPGASGIAPLPNGREAFAVRFQLAEAAQRTLDVQYYIWHDDVSGTLLLDALRRAADRGVQVRLLLDDGGTTGMDAPLAAIDAHPNVEVRLFNPFAQRKVRWLAWLTDFRRLNRRMHNKSFTADRAATVVGGRNVGDEYFDVSDEVQFIDLDVLAVGPVVDAVAKDFERYWNAEAVWPAAALLPQPDAKDVEAQQRRAAERQNVPAALGYRSALERAGQVKRLLAHELDFEWTRVQLVSDDPAKAQGTAPAGLMLPALLRDLLGTPRREVEIVSSYFVPLDEGVRLFRELTKAGVKVSILTNSLSATDVAAVHAGYARYRKPLLHAGVALYEMRGSGQTRSAASLAGSGRPRGSSAASLHAKTIAVDRQRVFVGSFNVDPRSAKLNTEMGFVIDSPTLAGRVADLFIQGLQERAWLLRLEADGSLRWVDVASGRELRKEPEASPWLLALVRVLSWLPIDPLL